MSDLGYTVSAVLYLSCVLPGYAIGLSQGWQTETGSHSQLFRAISKLECVHRMLEQLWMNPHLVLCLSGVVYLALSLSLGKSPDKL